MARVSDPGERNLRLLLLALSPKLVPGEYVFCSFAQAHYGDHSALEPVAVIMEGEGLTLVVPKSKAEEGAIDYQSVFRCITLNVHSSLDALGLTAAVAGKLAEQGISANVIAGYYHDHIYVQAEHAEKAIAALEELTSP